MIDMYFLINSAPGYEYSKDIMYALFAIGSVSLIACCLWVYVIKPTPWVHFSKGWIQAGLWRNFFKKQLESNSGSRIIKGPSFKSNNNAIPFVIFDYVYLTKNNVYIFTKTMEGSVKSIQQEKNTFFAYNRKARKLSMPKEYDVVLKHAHLFRKTFNLNNVHVITVVNNKTFAPVSKKDSINMYFGNHDDVLEYINKNEAVATEGDYDLSKVYPTLLKANFGKNKKSLFNFKNSFLSSPY